MATISPAPAVADAAQGSDGGPRIYGVVDIVRPDRVAGWAIDRADSAAAVEIEIRREGRVVATVRADRTRKDLERGGVGTGRYGFVADLNPPLEPGFEFTVAVAARSPDGVNIPLRRSGASGAPADPDRRLLERIFEELRALHALPEPEPGPEPEPDPADGLAATARRLDLAQMRIEAALGAIEPAAPPAIAGLRALVVAALLIGLGSFALGLVSMFAG